jgi:hypothetical protein
VVLVGIPDILVFQAMNLNGKVRGNHRLFTSKEIASNTTARDMFVFKIIQPQRQDKMMNQVLVQIGKTIGI